jgi:hypothetical protein
VIFPQIVRMNAGKVTLKSLRAYPSKFLPITTFMIVFLPHLTVILDIVIVLLVRICEYDAKSITYLNHII